MYAVKSLYIRQVNKKYQIIYADPPEVFLQTDPRGAALYADKKKINELYYTNSYCIY